MADEVAGRLSGPLLRPPGALPEAEFLLACTRCDACVEACPYDAIVKAGPGAGAAANTPVIVPTRMPCYLCDDLPCIPSCADGALLPIALGRAGVRMGTAVLHPRACLAVRGEACDICIQCCPFPGEALRADGRGHPVVSADRCTGCGICAQVCPSEPRALSIRPGGGNQGTTP